MRTIGILLFAIFVYTMARGGMLHRCTWQDGKVSFSASGCAAGANEAAIKPRPPVATAPSP
jgi:hypothetical protein